MNLREYAIVASLLLAMACGGGREDPILQLSAAEALEQCAPDSLGVFK